MAEALLDSDVVIWHLRGRRSVVDLVVSLASRSRLGVSAVTRTEVLAGARPGEVPATRRFLDTCETVPVDAGVADVAGEIVRENRGRGITTDVPDALIAAAAVTRRVPLYTCNPRHYVASGLDVRAVRP